jgi:hypothetical protein
MKFSQYDLQNIPVVALEDVSTAESKKFECFLSRGLVGGRE